VQNALLCKIIYTDCLLFIFTQNKSTASYTRLNNIISFDKTCKGINWIKLIITLSWTSFF